MRNLLVLCTALVLVVLAGTVASAQTYTTPPSTQPAQPQPQQTVPAQQPSQPAPGQQGAPGQVPNIAGLKPFSPEADFMSLAGYLRYLMHQATGQWVTYAEAKRAAQQQGAQ